METMQTNFQPLERLPLKFGGVFGIAWTLYRRSFKGLVPLCLLLYTLPMLLAYTPMLLNMQGLFFTLESMPGSMYGMQEFFGSTMRTFSLNALSSVLTLACSFLLLPGLTAVLYMEMDQCMDGHRGSFGQLLKVAFPIGFKQFYTTYLAQYVGMLCLNFAMSMVMLLCMFLFIIPMAVTAAFSSAFPVGLFVGLVVLGVVAMSVGYVFLALLYPVAVHEGLRAFKALGRAMKLAARRFRRVLGAMLVYTLVVLVVVMLFFLPMFISVFQGEVLAFADFMQPFIGVMAAMILLMTFAMPYTAALYTALYVDASARISPEPPPPSQPAGGSTYGQPME